MYTRLNKNRNKKYYTKIVGIAIEETERLLKQSPEITMYSVILNQLIDIKENIIDNNIVFSESELYRRYTIGAIAVKNFELENDEYAQKLSDVFGGTFDYDIMPEG